MSQTAKGRRTPLTLGAGPKSRKNSTEVTDKSSAAGNTDKSKDTVDQLKMKVSVALPEVNLKNAHKAQTLGGEGLKNASKNGNGNASTTSNTTTTKEDKIDNKKDVANATKASQVAAKPSPAKSETKSPSTNGNHKAATVTTSNVVAAAAVASEVVATPPPSATTTPIKESHGTKNGEKIDSSPAKPKETVRESPRQKELREKDEQREIEEAINAFRDNVPPTPPPGVVITPATPDTNAQAALAAKKGAATSPVSVAKEGTSGFVDSLLLEADMKGFTGDDEAMESLKMDDAEIEDSPMPKSKGVGKVLNMKQAPVIRSRVSPFRRSIEKALPNASTLVNLSTVSEQSTEYGAAGSPYGASLRIAGRKSMRPLREVTFRNLRETYRPLATDFNDSVSSMNATLGSEVGNESFRTPVVAVLGRKRTAAYENGDDDDAAGSPVESPKKARMDFSGFLGLMASPVTLLRNKFSRAKLQCSTPNTKSSTGADVVDGEDIVNVEAAVDEEASSGVETADVAAEDEVVEMADDALKEVNLDAPHSVDDIKDDVVIDEDETVPKRSRCAIM